MNKINLLKKFLLGVVCIMVAVSFVGCGGEKNNSFTWDEETQNKIKQDYLTQFVISDSPDATVSDVIIVKFYGVFNGCAVVMMNDVFSGFPDVVADYPYIIDDITIIYHNPLRAFAYKDKQFYELLAAYEQGLLTLDDIKTVADIQNGGK